MEPFVMEIAGFAIEVEPLFESTRMYCREYWTDREPEFHVTVAREELKQNWYGQLMTRPQTIAYFCQIDHWLRHYGVDIAI